MWIYFIIILIILILFCIALIAWKLSSVVINPQCITVEDAYRGECGKKYISAEWYEALDKEEFTIASKQGYNLACELIKNPHGGKKVAIICHGFSFNRVGSMKYVDIFMKNGFDVIIYDHRNCGYSGGKYTSMGYYESMDLSLLVDWVYNRHGEDCVIATHGESMGASTVLMHCVRDPRVDFVIEDCGYSDLKEQLAYRLKVEYKLPAFPFLYIASLFTKIRANFWFGDVSPKREIAESGGLPDIPVMFIHGAEDDYIPNSMCKDMYDLKKGKKAIYIAKGAKHAGSYCADRNEYEKRVTEFLNI